MVILKVNRFAVNLFEAMVNFVLTGKIHLQSKIHLSLLSKGNSLRCQSLRVNCQFADRKIYLHSKIDHSAFTFLIFN